MSTTLLVSCSSCGPDPEPEASKPVPAQVYSGFNFVDDAFTFENFGGGAIATGINTSVMIRLFGEEAVCVPESDPCELEANAQLWMEGTNLTIAQGRSEGFSLTALAFFSGAISPSDFGAEKVADLQLHANFALQEELAYWAATQAVPMAAKNDVRHQARDVMPFLAEALAPDHERHYRLAIAQRTDSGFARGHALTPIGYFKDNEREDTYWLRVYDNNFPSREQLLEIHPAANTWRYEVPGIDGAAIVYESTEEKPNYLYFAAIEDRAGVLPAPFAEDSEYLLQTYSGVAIVASNEDGEETGIRDGEVVEADGDWVTPAFSRCPLCGTAVAIVNQATLARGFKPKRNITISSSPGVTSSASGDTKKATVQSFGGLNSSKIEVENPKVGDAATMGANGDVSYSSKEGNGQVSITSTRYNNDGSSTTVTVTVDASNAPVSIEVTNNDDGTTTVDVSNLPEGTKVSVTSTSKNKEGSTNNAFDYISNGERSTATVDSASNRVMLVTPPADAAICSNGKKDASESDQDCGGSCGPTCDEGKACGNDGDCGSGFCEASLCAGVDPDCDSGTVSFGETDVDCGGETCDACVATASETSPRCLSNSDCDTGICSLDRCRITYPVYVEFNQLPTKRPFEVYSILDGKQSYKKLDLVDGTLRYEIGKAYAYKFTAASACTPTELRARVAGPTAEEPMRADGVIALECITGMTKPMRLTVEAGVDGRYTNAIQDNFKKDVAKFAISVDGGPIRIVEVSEHTSYLGEYQSFWHIAPIQMPALEDYVYSSVGAGEVGAVRLETKHQWDASSFNELGMFNANPGVIQPTYAIRRVSEGGVGSCFDRLHNQDETSTDCGGSSCPACVDGTLCLQDSDCEANSTCLGHVCTSNGTCSDMVKNQNESDIDCGGVCMTGCQLDAACNSNSDCATGLECEANICVVDTCQNMIKDANEADIDCGGTSSCARCSEGQECGLESDCSAGNTCLNDICVNAQCNNMTKDGMEGDVDCGGMCATKCIEGRTCGVNADCSMGNICLNNVCANAQCNNMTKDGMEGDVDCGGMCTTKCALGSSCNIATDCETGIACVNNVCAMDTCQNMVKDGGESGVDCGGSSACGSCPVGQTCTADSDCASDDCECGVNSGNCSGASGTCGAGKILLDQPVTDGTTASGTFTIPAGCTTLFVQAWGAAGGAEDQMGFASIEGGGAGYVDGTIAVTPGDVATIWLGQGGESGTFDGGNGSYLGTPANGGAGGFGMFGSQPGGGGGLTSIQITGTTPYTWSVPAGAGGHSFSGEETTVTLAGMGGAVGYDGDTGSSDISGGGAGDPGGVESTAGAYGMLPAGLTGYDGDGFGHTPGGTTNNDYSSCTGANMIDAGAGNIILGSGGDACVVLRCVAP